MMPRKNFGPTQKCAACQEVKDASNFGMQNKVRGWRSSYCRDCRRAKDRKRIAEGKRKWKKPDPAKNVQYRIKYRFGISYERYTQMLEEQKGVCAICGLPPEHGTRLAVDHDHRCCAGKRKPGGRDRSCGKCIRGLLHVHCNTAIGWFQDSPEVAMRAFEYLTKYAAPKPGPGAPNGNG